MPEDPLLVWEYALENVETDSEDNLRRSGHASRDKARDHMIDLMKEHGLTESQIRAVRERVNNKLKK